MAMERNPDPFGIHRDATPTALREGLAQAHELFTEAKAAGFTASEAMLMVTTMMSSGTAPTVCPHCGKGPGG